MLPRSGDVLRLDVRASVQFGGDRAIWFRVIRPMDITCTRGWVWLDGFELNADGDALLRREVFVQLAGLRMVDPVWVARREADRLRRRQAARGNARTPQAAASAVRRVSRAR